MVKRRIAVRKLNRTLLKKEGTKEIYITGKNVLMPFFGFDNMEELPTSRKDEDSKRVFKFKKILYGENNSEMTLRVTRENNEVRLTGFEDFFKANDLNEVDQIIIECMESDGVQKYALDYLKCNNTRVLQSYDTKDSYVNYNVSKNKKGAIQFTELPFPAEQYEGAYWLWDDSFDESRWNEIINKPIEICLAAKGKVYKKTVKIVKTNEVIKKLMKAKSSSVNQAVFQEKELYRIYEPVGDEWMEADFMGIRNLELTDEGNRMKLCSRDAVPFCLYEGGWE